MFAKKRVILITLLFVAVATGVSLAQFGGDRGEEITITKSGTPDSLFANGNVHYITDLQPPDCPIMDHIKFRNSTGSWQIRIRNTKWPDGASQQNQQSVAPGDTSTSYGFCCGWPPPNKHEGVWIFLAEKDPEGTPVCTTTVRVTCAAIPTMTSWGVLILVLLIGGTGIWILTRKRLAARQA